MQKHRRRILFAGILALLCALLLVRFAAAEELTVQKVFKRGESNIETWVNAEGEPTNNEFGYA